MPLFEIKVSSTVVNHGVEADFYDEAVALVMEDLSTRFAAYTEVVSEDTIIVDVTAY